MRAITHLLCASAFMIVANGCITHSHDSRSHSGGLIALYARVDRHTEDASKLLSLRFLSSTSVDLIIDTLASEIDEHDEVTETLISRLDALAMGYPNVNANEMLLLNNTDGYTFPPVNLCSNWTVIATPYPHPHLISAGCHLRGSHIAIDENDDGHSLIRSPPSDDHGVELEGFVTLGLGSHYPIVVPLMTKVPTGQWVRVWWSISGDPGASIRRPVER